MGALADADRLIRWGSATLHEACPEPSALPASLRPAWAGATIVGRAYPVVVAPGDNLALHWAIVEAEPGDVIVADAHDAVHGHWGEVMAVGALSRGIAGLVIAGGVRDTAQQAELGFPVFSTSIAVRGTAKRWSGVLGEPVAFGGVSVSRGDVIVADADGVVCVPRSSYPETVENAAARVAKEEAIMTALRAGSTTLDEYRLRGIDDRSARSRAQDR
ncbi:dimethylmenaquinone methyltransferase [Microbacterium betulae]|uniref:Putative 4-hydroxy-4-methyl-2-oxoglutarate aldolase n=1 Tax=Microbacterium betulae TaxID=2981139 RepID=A0AA97I681_9MICO|nr:dimethylmenaquinone methyltransferase [Microbacterium sp. AB]WOF22872.1 dimethylmenaquinone methyltransferase [Microbacterium sp. AB]